MPISLTFLRKKSFMWLYVAGAVLLVVAGGLWLRQQCMDPERVFWATVEQGLATKSVSIEAEQVNNGMTVHQTMQYTLGASNISRSFTRLAQPGTDVRTEMLGTPKVDYTRYTTIKTDQTKADGSAMDFSSILGQWAKTEEGAGQFFQQAILGTALPLGGMGVPIGYFDPATRQELLRQLRDDAVYQVAYDNVKKERKNGRLVYVYDVTLQPVAFVAFIKQFASEIGLHGLEQLDPNTYKEQTPVKLRLTVDVRAHHITEASIVGEESMSQRYSAYDVPVGTSLPTQTISSNELQERLTKLQ